MSALLYVKASPRGERSRSIRVTDAFVAAWRKRHPDATITTLDLFREDLPAFDGAAIDAKYAILAGRAHSEEQAAAWREVERVIDTFVSSDRFVFATPMWNFGLPYRLKQYIDLVVQPGYTFAFSPETGYSGLVKGKALVTYARGGAYSEGDAARMDFQKPYLEGLLGFIGITDVQSIVIEPTLQGGPEVADERTAAAVAEARALAERF